MASSGLYDSICWSLKEHEEEQADYMEICNEISQRCEAGEIALYAKIGQADITLCYVEKTAAQIAESDKATQTIAVQIAELEKKDKRNKEIATENSVNPSFLGIITSNTHKSYLFFKKAL